MKPLTPTEQAHARELLAPGGVPLPSVASIDVGRDGAQLQVRGRRGARRHVQASPDAIRELLAMAPGTVTAPVLFDLDSTGVIHGGL